MSYEYEKVRSHISPHLLPSNLEKFLHPVDQSYCILSHKIMVVNGRRFIIFPTATNIIPIQFFYSLKEFYTKLNNTGYVHRNLPLDLRYSLKES